MPNNDDLLKRIGDLLQQRRNWYELPDLLAMPQLVVLRNQLRQENLKDTEEPPLEKKDPPTTDPAVINARTTDGSNNDLHYPRMGSTGARFGRNVPLENAFPDTANLMNPNPRVVSRELMTRNEFIPAGFLNLLAAAWIQFMVHDWFAHDRSSVDKGIEIPLAPGDDWSDPKMKVPRSVPDPAPPGSTRPPAYANLNSHWWDASQLYGDDKTQADRVRGGEGGKLKVDPNNMLPVDPVTGVTVTGFNQNWWVGLTMLHTLFTREHNHICDLLAKQYPTWNDEQIFEKAKLINSALLAKIHTVEWSTAILPNRITTIALRTNWYGLVGEELQDVFTFLNDDEILGGELGSHYDHFTAPYSLTEEFVAVYRMHPLMPDSVAFRTTKGVTLLETVQLPELAERNAAALAGRISMLDLFYSFGRTNPGAVTLHNYPRHLQNLTRPNGEHLDLAAVDILRDRERGVPRYNQFRRLIHKDPVKSIDELTPSKTWRDQIKSVYNNNIEMVDLMTGLYAEPLPKGFGFSDTAFRIFLLMASRRLKSDRFFTDDYRVERYTEFGLDYIKQNSMVTILKRHFPELTPALDGLDNAFKPWSAVHT